MEKSSLDTHIRHMTIRWSHLLIPIGGAALAALVGSVAFWDASKPSIVTGLSVIGAGVLVRLARGLPFTNADHFTLDEARQVAAAVQLSVRSLRALLAIVFVAMASLIFAAPIAHALAAVPITLVAERADSAVSAIVGFLLTYVFVRVFAVVQGDLGIVDLQSRYLVTSVARKQGSTFEKDRASRGGTAIKNPEGYGTIVQSPSL